MMIELQILQVTDVTNTNKIMFTMNVSGNLSGNFSGNWDDTRHMSRRDMG